MNKIKINKISKEVYQTKGFDEKGCYGCSCDDACCKYGCDVDKESLILIFENRNIIESKTGIKLENCFERKFSNDKEFLGKNSKVSKIGKNGYCIFHKKEGKGCNLYEVVLENKINRRLIPSICRMFPISWDKGRIIMYDEMGIEIPPTCNIFDKENATIKNIFETQKNEMEDIFEI